MNDTNAGLVGPIVIYPPGKYPKNPATDPKEVFLLFAVMDESKSRYVDLNLINNVKTVAGPHGTRLPVTNTTHRQMALSHLKRDPLFRKYSKKHTVNGRAMCTLGGLRVRPPSPCVWIM